MWPETSDEADSHADQQRLRPAVNGRPPTGRSRRRALGRPGPAHPCAKTSERRRAKSCPVTSPAMAPAILAPPRAEGSIGLA
jgi:hypothetical protein